MFQTDFLLQKPISCHDATQISPLTLAFVGDAVQTLYSRVKFLKTGDFKSGALHKMVAAEVNAKSQATLAKTLEGDFSEIESDIFRRARNTKINTSAKNTSLADYRLATGLEAVLGFLYLTGEHERLLYLLRRYDNL